MSEQPREPKQRYRGPEIVDVGEVQKITTALSQPVRDNPGETPVDWDNPNPPKPERSEQ